MAPSNDDTFLGRWSRRKQEAARDKKDDGASLSEQAKGPQTAPADPTVQGDGKMAAQSGHKHDVHGAGQLAELAKVDIETLDFGSDYTPFMHKGVPESLQSAALRKLWASDPVFSTLDGLDDCCADYSDAAWAEPGIKTAYRIGRGFLTDTEVEEWANLGKPKQIAATDEKKVESGSESETAVVTGDVIEVAQQGFPSATVDGSGACTTTDARPAASTGEHSGDEATGSAAGGIEPVQREGRRPARLGADDTA